MLCCREFVARCLTVRSFLKLPRKPFDIGAVICTAHAQHRGTFFFLSVRYQTFDVLRIWARTLSRIGDTDECLGTQIVGAGNYGNDPIQDGSDNRFLMVSMFTYQRLREQPIVGHGWAVDAAVAVGRGAARDQTSVQRTGTAPIRLESHMQLERP
jgi:hypothetical protein